MWSTNMTVTYLFMDKTISIWDNNNKADKILIKIPTIKETLINSDLQIVLQFFQKDFIQKIGKMFKLKDMSTYQVWKNFMTNPIITNLQEFSFLSQALTDNINKILPDFNIKERELYCGKIKLNVAIVEQIQYYLLTALGSKIEEPVDESQFKSEAAKKLYEQQKAAEAKIAQIKANNINEEEKNKDKNTLLKIFIEICYKFPFLKIEDMYDLTMIQVLWLQEYASKCIAYETGIMAYTAGNLKKMPQFFLK